MAKASSTMQLNVSAEQVWNLIGGFNALPDWHPAVEKSELEDGGKIRRLSLVGGGSIVERLERIDDKEHVYRYSIVESPLPVGDYAAELHVRANEQGDGCTIEWSGEFEPRGVTPTEAVEVIRGIYQAGFDNLKKLYGG